MAATRRPENENEALRRFVRRVWVDDIHPLLRGRYAEQRQKSARAVGKLAAGTGLLADKLLRLRGKPFTRALTVLGSTAGALLPDVWDWEWLRKKASGQQQKVVAERLRHHAAQLPERGALALFGLSPTATREELKQAWRTVSQRWHPDKATTDASRAEHHIRFIAYQAAYERLTAAYESGRLPAKE